MEQITLSKSLSHVDPNDWSVCQLFTEITNRIMTTLIDNHGCFGIRLDFKKRFLVIYSLLIELRWQHPYKSSYDYWLVLSNQFRSRDMMLEDWWCREDCSRRFRSQRINFISYFWFAYVRLNSWLIIAFEFREVISNIASDYGICSFAFQ